MDSDNAENADIPDESESHLKETKDKSRFRANYFLGFRITNGTILENIEEFQNDLISAHENLANFVEAPCKAHVTLPVLQLDRKSDEVDKCIKLLTENLKFEIQNNDNIVKFQGVGKFGSRVIFAKPVTGVPFLKSIFSLTQKILVEGA